MTQAANEQIKEVSRYKLMLASEEQLDKLKELVVVAEYVLAAFVDFDLKETAGKILKDLGKKGEGTKGAYTLGQRNEMKKLVNDVPVLFANYIETMKEVISITEGEQAREKEEAKAAAEAAKEAAKEAEAPVPSLEVLPNAEPDSTQAVAAEPEAGSL